ncbi:MAG: 50S ribosomal protein L28 [Spirochaetes bacterium]|nr:50S ribosomal protein L28 [Spirochaetota bacterium]
MAKCVICGKGPISGNNVSHSHLKTRRVWQPNIQKAKVNIKGSIKRINVCTKCLKSGKVQKVI